MSDRDETQPVEHGFGSSAAITVAESGKGLVVGAGGGLWRGALIGGALSGLLWGGLAFGLMSLIGLIPLLPWFAATAATVGLVVGSVAAVGGALVGGVVGTPAGAVAGTFKGIGEGADIVTRDRAAAQMARSQEATAGTQTETAKALQAKIIERMSQQAQPVVTAPTVEHCGQGLVQTPQQGAGGNIAQRIQQQQLAAASAEQQV